jgi:RNA polymerase sigma-70 factor (ECF subfamily)
MPVPSEPVSEESLIVRAQQGEAEALAQLYEAHAPAVFRYIYFRVRDRHIAEDITADVFVRMVEALPHFELRGLPFAAWLFRVAHDRVVDHHRRAAVRRPEVLPDTLVDAEANTEAAALQTHSNAALIDRLSELTDEQQAVLQLRFIEGYSLEQTAAALAKTQGAVKALQHRALRQLARWLDREQ